MDFVAAPRRPISFQKTKIKWAPVWPSPSRSNCAESFPPRIPILNTCFSRKKKKHLKKPPFSALPAWLDPREIRFPKQRFQTTPTISLPDQSSGPQKNLFPRHVSSYFNTTRQPTNHQLCIADVMALTRFNASVMLLLSLLPSHKLTANSPYLIGGRPTWRPPEPPSCGAATCPFGNIQEALRIIYPRLLF